MAGDGRVLHPPVAGPLSEAERDFLRRCRLLFEGVC